MFFLHRKQLARIQNTARIEDSLDVALQLDLVKAAIAEQARLIEKVQEYIRGESY